MCGHLKIAFVAFFVLLQNSGLSAGALEANNNKTDPARDAMADILALQDLIAQYSLHAAVPSFNRGRRNWCWDMGNALPTEGGLIAATSIFASHRHDKQAFSAGPPPSVRAQTNHIDDSKVSATIIPQIAGQAVGGLGSAFELGCSMAKNRRLKKEGLTRAAIIARAMAIKTKIDNDIAGLRKSESATRAGQALLLQKLEGVNMARLKCVLAKASALKIGDDAEDMISMGRNLIGASGNSINVAAIQNNDRVLNGAGAIANLVAAGMITTRPLVINALRKFAGQRSDKRFDTIFGASDWIDPAFDLDVVAADVDPQTMAFYRAEQKLLQRPVCFAIDVDQDPKLMMLRRFRETIYGPQKISQATLGIVIGFRHQVNSTKDNQLAAAGNITYMSGQAFNILELSRERIIDERKHKTDKASGNLPEDLIKIQIKQIGDLKAELIR